MDYLLHILILSSIYRIAVLGLNYSAGFGGMISVGHGAMMGIGAYTSAILLTKFGMAFFPAIFLAIMITGLIAFVISYPLLKLKGDSFILVSFGWAFIAYNLFLNLRFLTDGPLGIKGIPLPNAFWISGYPKFNFFIIVLVTLIIITIFLHRICRSSYGTIIKAVRENAKIAAITGHNSQSYQRSIFVVSAMITGVAGAYLGMYLSTVSPTLFTEHLSVLLIIMVIFSGLGSLKGSVIGATILIILPEILRFLGLPSSILAESQQIAYGLILICVMYLHPKGLFGTYRI